MTENAVVDNAQHFAGDGAAGRELVEDRGPRIVPELLHAEADLLLVVIDAENDGLDVVALLVHVAKVVDFRRPRHVDLVHHSIDTFLDAHEDAVLGNASDLPATLVARLVLLGEESPRITLALLHAT